MGAPLLTLVQVAVPVRLTPEGRVMSALENAGVEDPKVWLPDTETARAVGGVGVPCVAGVAGAAFGLGVVEALGLDVADGV